MTPKRTFNIHGTFHSTEGTLEFSSHQENASFKNCSLKGYLGNQNIFFNGIAAAETFGILRV